MGWLYSFFGVGEPDINDFLRDALKEKAGIEVDILEVDILKDSQSGKPALELRARSKGVVVAIMHHTFDSAAQAGGYWKSNRAVVQSALPKARINLFVKGSKAIRRQFPLFNGIEIQGGISV